MRVRSTGFVMPTDPLDAYRSVVVAIFCSGLYLLGDAIARILMQQALLKDYGFATRLLLLLRR